MLVLLTLRCCQPSRHRCCPHGCAIRGAGTGARDNTSLACLRKLDAGALRDVGVSQGKVLDDRGWGPVVDGVALPKAPLDRIEAGGYNAKVPVLSGTNRDEVRVGAAPRSPGPTSPLSLTISPLSCNLQRLAQSDGVLSNCFRHRP